MSKKEHARSRRELADPSRKSGVSAGQRPHNFHRYHWRHGDYKGDTSISKEKSTSQREPKESDSRNSYLRQSGSSGVSLCTNSIDNSRSRRRSIDDMQIRRHGKPPSPASLIHQRSIDQRGHQNASNVRLEEAIDGHQGMTDARRKRNSVNSERSCHSASDGNTNIKDRALPTLEGHRTLQSSPGYGESNMSVNSDQSEVMLSFNSDTDRIPRKSKPRKVMKDDPRESRTADVLQASGGVIQSIKQGSENFDSSCLNETDEQKANDVNLRDTALLSEEGRPGEASSTHNTATASSTASDVLPRVLNYANPQRQKEEALRALLGVKKEPGSENVVDPSKGCVSCISSVKVKQEPCDTDHSSSSALEIGSPRSLPSPHQCLFVHIDGARCNAIAVERYCSYHQILRQKQQNQSQETSVTAAHRRASPPAHIDLNSSLDGIGDLRTVAAEPSLPTINLSDTVANPGRPLRETRSPGERDFGNARETVVARKESIPPGILHARKESSPPRILYQEDAASPPAVPHRVLAFNPEKLPHPGGSLPKVSAFGLPHREGYDGVRAPSAGGMETRESQRGSTQAETSVGMIDLSFSSQFLGLHAPQQPAGTGPSALPSFGLPGEKARPVWSPGPSPENTAPETGRSAPGSEVARLARSGSQENSRNGSPSPSNSTGRSAPGSEFARLARGGSHENPRNGSPSPSNPTGRSAPGSEFARLARGGSHENPRNGSPSPSNPTGRSAPVSEFARLARSGSQENSRNSSPSPSALTVDLSRFNLPSAVRRALATRLGTKQAAEDVEDSATKPAGLHLKFTDEPRSIGSSERTKQGFAPARRVRRSVSLDSRPKVADILPRDEVLGTSSIRRPSPVLGTSRKEFRSPAEERNLAGYMDASAVSSSQQTKVPSFKPGVGASTEGSSSLQTRGMIDLSSVAYLEAAGEGSSTKKDSFARQTPQEDAGKRGTLDSLNEEGKTQVSFKRKRLGSVDEVGTGGTGATVLPKKMRPLEADSERHEELASYRPGVNIQELLGIEREEQRQLGALSRVQGQLKDVRSQIQRLCTVLDGLHADENSIASRMDQLRSERLNLLQNALYAHGRPFARSTRTSVASSTTEEPAREARGAADGELASSSCVESLPQRSAAGEGRKQLGEDVVSTSVSHDAYISLGRHSPSGVGVAAESYTPHAASFPSGVNSVQETPAKAGEAAFSSPPAATDTDYETTPMDFGSDAPGTDYEVQAMDFGSDSTDGAQTVRDPTQRGGKNQSGKAGQPDRPSHRTKFGRILNQTRARVSLGPDSPSEERAEVGPTAPEERAELTGVTQAGLLSRGGVPVQRRRVSTRSGEEAGQDAVYLTSRHRRDVMRNIKLQPKRAPTWESRASSALAVSKQRLESARENMSRWKEQAEDMGEGVANTRSATPCVAKRVSIPGRTTKELKKSSLFKARNVSASAEALKLKRQRRKERRARVRAKRDNSGGGALSGGASVDPRSAGEFNKATQMGEGRVNPAEAGVPAKRRRGRSSSSTAVPCGGPSSAQSQTGTSSSSASVDSNRATPSSMAGPQGRVPPRSTRRAQTGAPLSSRSASPAGAPMSTSTVSQTGAPTNTRTGPQDRALPSSAAVLQKRTSTRTTRYQKGGTSSCITTKPNRRTPSASSDAPLRDRDPGAEEPGSGVMTVKCESDDCRSLINEVPTRDVGNDEPTFPDHVTVQTLADPPQEQIVRKCREKKRVGQALAAFEGQKCHTGAVCGLKVSGHHLFTCSTDKMTKSYDVQTGECVKSYTGHHHAVNCLEITEDGSRLFTGSNDQTVRSYNLKSSVCTHKFTFDGRVMCVHLAFGTLFVGLSTGIVACIDVKENSCVERLHCHNPRGVSCLASATEGRTRLLCSGSFDSTIRITDVKSGLLLRALKDHEMTVLCIQVVEDVIYSGSADKRVQAHNINTGELLRSYDGHTKTVSGLQIVGRVLVTSCLDKLIRCYDLTSAELLQVYGGHSDMLFSVHVANGRIFSGARDGSVSCVKLDLRVYYPCKWKDCALKFGILSHLKSHVQDTHVIQEGTIKACHWTNCQYKFARTEDIEAVLGHIMSHADASTPAGQAK